MVRAGGGRRFYDSPGRYDAEIGELEDYLLALQDEVTGVRLRLGRLRIEEQLRRKK